RSRTSVISLPSLRPPHTATSFPYTTLFRSQTQATPTDRFGCTFLAAIAANVGGEIPQANLAAVDVQFVEAAGERAGLQQAWIFRSEEHTSELQSRENLVCRLLREKKRQSEY